MLIGQKTPEQKQEEALKKQREEAERQYKVQMRERSVVLAMQYIGQVYTPPQKEKADLLAQADKIFNYLNR